MIEIVGEFEMRREAVDVAVEVADAVDDAVLVADAVIVAGKLGLTELRADAVVVERTENEDWLDADGFLLTSPVLVGRFVGTVGPADGEMSADADSDAPLLTVNVREVSPEGDSATDGVITGDALSAIDIVGSGDPDGETEGCADSESVTDASGDLLTSCVTDCVALPCALSVLLVVRDPVRDVSGDIVALDEPVVDVDSKGERVFDDDSLADELLESEKERDIGGEAEADPEGDSLQKPVLLDDCDMDTRGDFDDVADALSLSLGCGVALEVAGNTVLVP